MGSDSIGGAQMCFRRRDLLSTRDFKENRAIFVPATDLESRRLVNTASIGSAPNGNLGLEPPRLSLNEGFQGEQSHLCACK